MGGTTFNKTDIILHIIGGRMIIFSKTKNLKPRKIEQ